MNKIEKKILSKDLCIGCGLCEAISKKSCKMELTSNGFYTPVFKKRTNKNEINEIMDICPGINVIDNQTHNTKVWGKVLKAAEAWSTDSEIRFKASSGGVASSLAINLIESKTVDAVLHVGNINNSYLYNELMISRSREDVLRNLSSRYAPALMFDRIFQLLQNSNEKYAFIGKPCDIAGLKNLIKVYPEFKNRIYIYIAIFCAGMPSYNATNKILDSFNENEKPSIVRYRGEGWPGNFKASYSNNITHEMSYDDSWGKVLGRTLGFRCKICPDGIGLLADISLGDSWNTVDGYPDFEDDKGRNFCLIRNEKGLKCFNEALKDKSIESKDMKTDVINLMQPYQYQRRHLIGWRILPILFTVKFKGLGIFRLALRANLKQGISNMIGSFYRLYRN